MYFGIGRERQAQGEYRLLLEYGSSEDAAGGGRCGPAWLPIQEVVRVLSPS
jgi:hypothetical protein